MVKQKRLTYLDLACQTSRKRLCSKMRRFGDLAANNCPQIMVFDWADSYRYFGWVWSLIRQVTNQDIQPDLPQKLGKIILSQRFNFKNLVCLVQPGLPFGARGGKVSKQTELKFGGLRKELVVPDASDSAG